MANALRPSDIDLRIEINSSAPAELQEIGISYWEIVGLDSETGEPVWATKVRELDVTAWANAAHFAAAAAVTATVPDHSCSSCGGKLTLTSRKALTDTLQGRNVDCRACNTTVEQRVARILNPKSLEERARRLTERQAQETAAAAERELEQSRRDAIAARYPIGTDDSAQRIDDAPLLARIGALAVLHAVGHRAGLIYPVEFANETIGPNESLSKELFIAAWHAHLLQIHPTSPTDSFIWDDDHTLGDGIYVRRTRFFTPGDGTLEHRLETFASHLRADLELPTMWSTDRTELADLVHRVIAEEAGRYLVYQLCEHNLPDLTATHEEALRTVTHRGASHFPIGHLYRMAWSSARDASSAYQRHAGMSKENAITHGLKQFERWIQRASENPESLNAPFREDTTNLPLTAVTSVVFRTILGLDPMSADPAQIDDLLAAAPDAEVRAMCDHQIPEHTELMEWIRTSADHWEDDEFRRIVAVLENSSADPCAPGCAHEHLARVATASGQLYDRIVSRVGDTDAAIVTAEATALANATQNQVRTGDAILADIVRMLRHPELNEKHDLQ
ncbi:hypothetical protein [Rhodococcus sp. LB1]|uniref:hypothetical protein n=1 Tax=Rhodococcus sp. LB1 TaxID=1807499 RepID=UPI00077A1217|nr:hypothetical protein [Rhodococcus sp. LB1]KXX59432.1 hypothetical protein AZG88_41320 [Rhodococcus sp. LB1]